jgi:hypothetical protein
LLGGCSQLPEIAPNQCGNAVVEALEDCDTFSPGNGLACRKKGAAGECHWDCSIGSDGKRLPCPKGWGCDPSGLCRIPRGDFEAPRVSAIGSTSALQAADFDGDGRSDLLSMQPLDLFGQTRVRFHYFDERAALSETRLFPKLMIGPFVGDLSDDGLADVAFSTLQVGVLLGRADRSWVPETFSSYRVAGSSVHMLAIADDPGGSVGQSSSLIVVASLDEGPGFYIPDLVKGALRRLGGVDGVPERLIGGPVSGQVIEGVPCRQIAFALGGESHFSLLALCEGTISAPEWKTELTADVFQTEPPSVIQAAPQIADMNGDGHLDVLLATAAGLYVSLGDGHSLAKAKPFSITLAEESKAPDHFPMPLALGDFSGDGLVDFVFKDYLLVSVRDSLTRKVAYRPLLSYAEWNVALIADLDRDGAPEVAAASERRLDIDLVSGTGTSFVWSRVPTGAPVRALSTGDYDGDSIGDLAFVEQASVEGERDSLKIAFGTAFGEPLPPVDVARIGHVEELGTFQDPGLAGLTLVSTEIRAGNATVLVTLLDGTPDRLPYAPYMLVDFSEADSSLVTSAALALSAGSFTAPKAKDVLALARIPIVADFQSNPVLECQLKKREYDFWLLAGLETSQSRQTPLKGLLDPRLEPAETCDTGITHIGAVGAAADLNRDGRDEAIWAMPADEGAGCGIAIVGVPKDGSAIAVQWEPLILEEPCDRPQIMPLDADSDGFTDIALLTRSPGAKDRSLVVLWNDHGQFSVARKTRVNPIGDSPEAFAALEATPRRPLTIAYVARGAVILRAAQPSRTFSDVRRPQAVPSANAIAAGDFDGDGVQDLAVAASGNLSVFRAALER